MLVKAPNATIAHKTAGTGITHCGITVTSAWKEATLQQRICRRCRAAV